MPVIKATNTHSEHVMLFCFSSVTVVTRERAPMFRYTYIACPVRRSITSVLANVKG